MRFSLKILENRNLTHRQHDINMILKNSYRIVLFFVLLSPFSAFSQEPGSNNTLTIAAIVNDKIITVSDLNNRVEFVLNSSSMPRTEEAIHHLKIQLLKTFIDEELQIQEAEKHGISISKEEIDQAISEIERNNNMTPGQLKGLLEKDNIPLKTLEDQIRANLSWMRYIVDAYGASVTVSDKEAEDVLKTLSKSIDQPQRHVSEIFLPINDPSEEKEVLSIAADFVKDLRKGASFDMFARQFSKAPSAGQGGDIGWIRQGQLSEALDKSLSTLQKGLISDPIRTKGGVYILYVKDIEKAGESTQTVLDVKQVTLNLFIDKSEEALEEAKKTLEKIKPSLHSCEDLEEKSAKIGAHVESLMNVPEKKLPLPLVNLIKNLPLNTPSSVVTTPEGAGFMMVCKRSEVPVQESTLPNKESVERKLTNQKLELIARRVIKDLRRAAFIETRI